MLYAFFSWVISFGFGPNKVFEFFNFGVRAHGMSESSGVKLKNGLKIGLKTMVLVGEIVF